MHPGRDRRRRVDGRAARGCPRRHPRSRGVGVTVGGAVRHRRWPALPRRHRPELYFIAGRDPWNGFKIWDGGLGIWGAVLLGGVGVLIGACRAGVPLPPLADAIAPGIAVAQASGGGATGSTRSCSAARPPCPGGFQSTPHTARLATAPTPRSNPRSCWSHCGVWAWPPWWSGPTAGSRWVTDAPLPCTSPQHRGTGMDRVPSHRHRQPHPWSAPQRLDLPGGIHRVCGLLRDQRPPPPGA
jgi:Prolipoprotein diacylglyceryl transferase